MLFEQGKALSCKPSLRALRVELLLEWQKSATWLSFALSLPPALKMRAARQWTHDTPVYVEGATHCQAHASATALPIAAISARAKARARTEKGVRPTNSRVEDPARVVRQAVKLKCNMSSYISLGPAKDHPHPFNLTFKAASLSDPRYSSAERLSSRVNNNVAIGDCTTIALAAVAVASASSAGWRLPGWPCMHADYQAAAARRSVGCRRTKSVGCPVTPEGRQGPALNIGVGRRRRRREV